MTVSSLKLRVLQRFVVEHFCLLRVNLIERSGGDGEFYVSDEVVDVFFAPDNVCFVAEDDVCFVWVDVLHDGFDVRELRCDVFDDLRFVRKSFVLVMKTIIISPVTTPYLTMMWRSQPLWRSSLYALTPYLAQMSLTA